MENYGNWDSIFDIFRDTLHFLRPKKFLSFNNIQHPHRVQLKDFLTVLYFGAKKQYDTGGPFLKIY